MLLLLAPPLLWLGVIYLGALFALLAQSLFSIDEFSGAVVYQPTLKTYAELLVARPISTSSSARSSFLRSSPPSRRSSAFPIAYYAARYARGKVKALFYVAVMMPLWSSYLVKVYAWKLLLAKEGAVGWFMQAAGLSGALDAWLAAPLVGGPSLSVSYTGMVLTFLYLWTPFMVLAASGGAGARAGDADRGVRRSRSQIRDRRSAT